MYTLDMIRSQRDDIHAITARYQVTNIRFFGSVARGSQDEYSDFDILVHPGPNFSLFTPQISSTIFRISLVVRYM